MSSERHLKNLKRLVISMGILLIVGFVITLAGAWMKFKAGASVSCNNVTVDMKGRGELANHAFQDGNWVLIFKTKDGLEIVRVDACGKLLNSLKIQTR